MTNMKDRLAFAPGGSSGIHFRIGGNPRAVANASKLSDFVPVL